MAESAADVADVVTLPDDLAVSDPGRACAVISNPTKVSATFRQLATERLTAAGWAAPLWLETSADDPGRAMTAQARGTGVELVIAAGGDGTIRIVADGLAGSDIAMGIVPAGTGNLLARNLGLPLRESEALEVAVALKTRTIDLVEVFVDDGPGEHFAVLAGMGVDAMIMDETNPALKSRIGPAAYFLAAAKAVGRLPMELTIKIDDHHVRRRRHALICAIGNVGALPGGITLIHGAEPDDGLLDVYVASPHRFTHWLRVLGRLVSRRGRHGDEIDQWRGRRVEVRLRKPDSYQLDGDVEGECRRFVAEIRPAALRVCTPG